MIKIGSLNENKVLTITINGKIKSEDYNKILPIIENLLKKFKAIRFYIELENFEGFELNALWDEIKFDYKYQSQYGRTAVIGDKKWEELATRFSNLFFDAEIQFFYKENSDKAWEWVNSHD